MPQSREYAVITKILEVLAKSPGGLRSKRQVAARVGGKYSTIFSYIDLLREHGFVSVEDVRTKRGNRPSVRVKLGLLGYLYIIYRVSIGSLPIATAGVIFRDAYQSLMGFLREEVQALQNLFEDDPWNKLCFFALQKFTQAESKVAAMVMEEISKRVFRKYLGPENILDIDYLGRIWEDKLEICDLILKGVREAHKKFFLLEGLSPEDLKAYLLTFGEAFEMLSKTERMDVVAAFKYEYDTLMRHLIRVFPRELREKCEEMMRQAGLHQIVCMFKCPKCGYEGASLQVVEDVLRTYTVRCGKCNVESSLAYLPRYYDKEIEEILRRWLESSGLKYVKKPLDKLYEDAP